MSSMLSELSRSKIHSHRVGMALSPEQYGIHIGVSGGTVRRVEAGYIPFLSTQKKFAAALETSHLELFGTPELRKPAKALVRKQFEEAMA